MINSTNSIHIDGEVIGHDDFVNAFNIDTSDSYTRWILRPLAFVTAVGIGLAALLASTMLLMLSLAMAPLLAVGVWAVKRKFEKGLENTEATDIGTPDVSQAHAG